MRDVGEGVRARFVRPARTLLKYRCVGLENTSMLDCEAPLAF
jgi:hypothetical protein